MFLSTFLPNANCYRKHLLLHQGHKVRTWVMPQGHYSVITFRIDLTLQARCILYEEISRLALINFLDDESLKQNANKLMFNSLSEIKEAFCGLCFF